MAGSAGPSATAAWTRRAAGPAERAVRTLPDAADPAIRFYLPERLALAGGPASPAVALTLLLGGAAAPGQESILPLVTSGILALEVTLAAGPLTPAAGERELRPLFARPVTVRLVTTGGQATTLAEGTGSGAPARVALTAQLDRQAALNVLSALNGDASPLDLQATVTYRAVAEPQRARLDGCWADVHDALAGAAGPDGTLTRAGLAAAYAQLVASGVLRASPGEAGPELSGPFASMAAAVVVEQLRGGELRLRPRPDPEFGIGIERAVGGTRPAQEVIGGPLADTLGGVLDRVEPDRVVTVVTLASGGPLSPTRPMLRAPRRVRSGPRPRDAPDGAARGFVDTGGPASLTTVAGFLHVPAGPSPKAHALLGGAAQLARADDGTARGRLGDDVIVAPGQEPLSLPVLDEAGSGWLWPDRRDPSAYWYLPTFEIVPPRPAQDPETGPFGFSFRRSGATASGQPGLDGTVWLRLRQVMGPEVAAMLAELGGPRARPVPADDLSVRLEVPFRDEGGTTRVQAFDSVTERSGDEVTAIVRLIDAWVRLCYGALSAPGFQSVPARVSVAWSFPGYARADPDRGLTVVFGDKAAVIPVRYAKPDPGDPVTAHFDAAAVTFRGGAGDLVFRDHAGPAGAGPARRAAAPFVVRPWMPATLPVIAGPAYRRSTFLRAQRRDLTVPCQTFGACYVEERADGPQAIGCVDGLQLGQTSYRQYAEIPELAGPQLRVFRSLQQPGRFLVLPAAYLIARWPASEGDRAYRPAVLLHALVDPEREQDNLVLVQATLQPDLPPYVLARLRHRLAGLAPDPAIVLPTDLDAVPSFAWTLDAAIGITVQATPSVDGIAVSLSSDLARGLLLRDLLSAEGVGGRLTLTLPDGSTLSTNLLLALDRLAGPLDGGPAETRLAGGSASITNRIERPVVVSDLLALTADAQLTPVPVERELAPGQSVTVDVAPGTSQAWPAYTLPAAAPATLEELRTFVEDIDTNLIFVDLIDHAGHDLARVDVRARLSGVPSEQDVPLTGTPGVGNVTFVLPLTTYLSVHRAEYQVTLTGNDGTSRSSGWTAWDLVTQGSIVSLTWDSVSAVT